MWRYFKVRVALSISRLAIRVSRVASRISERCTAYGMKLLGNDNDDSNNNR